MVNQHTELFQNLKCSEMMLERLYKFFMSEDKDNLIPKHLKWNSIRLNITDDIPSQYKNNLLDIVKIAEEIGYVVSILTHESKKNIDDTYLII